jgi:hypothetical protein
LCVCVCLRFVHRVLRVHPRSPPHSHEFVKIGSHPRGHSRLKPAYRGSMPPPPPPPPPTTCAPRLAQLCLTRLALAAPAHRRASCSARPSQPPAPSRPRPRSAARSAAPPKLAPPHCALPQATEPPPPTAPQRACQHQPAHCATATCASPASFSHRHHAPTPAQLTARNSSHRAAPTAHLRPVPATAD